MLYTFVCEMLFTYSILINMSHDSFWQAEKEVKQAEKGWKVKTLQEETNLKVKTLQEETDPKVKTRQTERESKVNTRRKDKKSEHDQTSCKLSTVPVKI